jgi:acyl transferase domain-containing protein/NAD(P)-dependent dehydrogenase (short-subunit alcohol dehydrogenase family)/ubiquinone/menaquinone biosynthesis C-methylase UbiE/acyl carrier protein
MTKAYNNVKSIMAGIKSKELSPEEGLLYLRRIKEETNKIDATDRVDFYRTEWVSKDIISSNESNEQKEIFLLNNNLKSRGKLDDELRKRGFTVLDKHNADVIVYISESKESFEDSMEESLYSVLDFFQNVLKNKHSKIKKIIYVYEKNQKQSAPVYESFVGFFNSLSLVMPGVTISNIQIDIDEVSIAKLAEIIDQEISTINERFTTDISYLSGKRKVKMLTKSENNLRLKDIYKKNGVYLVSGGAGAIGRKFASFLVENYDADVILFGRKKYSNEDIDALRKDIGSNKIEYFSVDVCDLYEVKKLIGNVEMRFGKINGIIHIAGSSPKEIISEKSSKDFEKTIKAKIKGARNLDEATANMELDFFMMYSSLSAFFGDFGQCDYAMGNRFLSAFSEYRDYQVESGLRFGKTICICWPLWENGGMHGNAGAEKLYKMTSGLEDISDNEGEYVFSNLPIESCTLVIKGSKERYANTICYQISDSIRMNKQTKKEKRGEVLAKLQEIVSKILMIPVDEISAEENIASYGFESLDLKDFAEKINSTWKINITPTVFFEKSTLGELSDYLLDKYAEIYADSQDKGRDISETALRDKKAKICAEEKNNAKKKFAIIGLDGIFPQSSNASEFWKNLEEDKCLVTEIPPKRWDFRHYYSEKIAPRKSNSKWGGFIPDIDKFDEQFFNISPREAEIMDPQQRLSIEVVWRAIEDAGYSASSLAGKDVGVFFGAEFSDYQSLMYLGGEVDAQVARGNAHAMLSNRISFIFDFNGPSEVIDTACSASLVAVKRAVDALTLGECSYAIVGGVSLNISPYNYVAASQMGMLSKDGRCKVFDKNANGFVKSEGVGAIVIKEYEQALKDGDNIYATIIGTAENHGGKSNSLTSPNKKMQTALIEKAYKDAEIDIDTVSYIETHGTGTELGDPIEVDALKDAFERLSNPNKVDKKYNYCGLGAVKSNIGHMESASGIGGIIKVLLSFKYKKLTRVLFEEQNPYIQLEKSPFYIIKQTKHWDSQKDDEGKIVPRRAGVSAFGFGGSNAHIVMEENLVEYKTEVDNYPSIFILSAKDEMQLKVYANRYIEFFENNYRYAKDNWQRIIYTLQIGRENMEARLAICASDIDVLLGSLRKIRNDWKRGENIYIGISGNEQSYLNDNNAKTDELAIKWVNGYNVNWKQYWNGETIKRISLPTYPFKKNSHWIKSFYSLVNNIFAEKAVVNDNKAMEDLLYLHKWKRCVSNGNKFLTHGKFGVLTPNKPSDAVFENLFNKSGAQFFWINSNFNTCEEGISEAKKILLLHPDMTGIIDLSDLSSDEVWGLHINPGKVSFLQQIIKSAENTKKMELIHITCNACAFMAQEVTMNGVLTAGLVRILAKEYKNVRAITADIEMLSEEMLVDGILKAYEYIDLNQICIRKGVVYRQYFYKKCMSVDSEYKPMTDKVYVVAGGTSGVGLELADNLVQNGAKKLVLMGVHSIPPMDKWDNIDNEEYDDKTKYKIRKFKSLIERGVSLEFYIGEITDEQKMLEYFAGIKEKLGRIGGVIQAAWCPFSDTPYFINKTVEQIENVLSPKVKGTYILSKIVKEEPIDFFVLCSSVSSAITDMGVGNCHYSMANYYLDCFSEYMQSLGNNAFKTINWIFWGETGAANSLENTKRLERLGIYFMSNQEGVSCFNKVLKSDENRFLAGRINEKMYKEMMCTDNDEINEIQEFHRTKLASFEQLHNIQKILDEYISLMIMKCFQTNGYFNELKKEYSVKQLMKDMHIIDKHFQLFIAMLSILDSYSYVSLEIDKDICICENNIVNEERVIAVENILHSAENEYKDIYALLKECFSNLNDILQGKQLATSIIFPKGSMSKVEPIYSKGDIIGHLNKVMSRYVFASVKKLLGKGENEKIRILEIGAGTGGTSRYVLNDLNEEQDNVKYCYTDVSNAFLIFAKNKFARYPFVEYKLLDVNGDFTEQGFRDETFDIVLATNVIHATKNINRTLTKINKLLKKDGIVIISEMMSVQNFATCIFGLLDDWWKYEDGDVRLDNSPLLSREAWEKQYSNVGFDVIDFFGVKSVKNNEIAQGVLCGRKVMECKELGIDGMSKNTEVKATSIFENAENNNRKTNMEKELIINKISVYLAELLHMDQKDVNSDISLAAYGIDSILVQTIIAGLEEIFNFSINPAMVLESGTIGQMAQYMCDNYANEMSSLFIDKKLVEEQNINSFSSEDAKVDTNSLDERKVAIIGMAGVFPEANSIDDYWEIIKDGRCCISEVPASRWNINTYYSDKMSVGKTVSKWGGFLDDITLFDPEYFEFSKEDAVHVDPLARKFLEVSAQAVSNAGYKREELNDRKIGVFAAGRVSDYAATVGGYVKNSIVGLGQNFIAANVSRYFNVHGPSMVIDTACSSSLVSIHEACKSIISGESEMALAGGVEILLNARPFLILSQMGAFSPNGICSPFDEKANGFVPGEGCGVIVLKNLKKAIEDGDKIYAVVDGAAVNCDGSTMGMTTPNPYMQKQVIFDALNQNNTDGATISYVEAHGTGTQIGDAIELKGLTEVLREYTDEVGCCTVGSVKANIGHLFLASGVASLIKSVLCIQNKKLPPLIHCDTPNPRYRFDNSPLVINRELTEWNPKCGIRRAGISSFGLGGTNAHVIVSEYNDYNYQSRRKPLGDIAFQKQRFWNDEGSQKVIRNNSRHMLNLRKDKI